jgi:hypothetical protein
MWPSDPQMPEIRWDISRKGRDWQCDEVWASYELAPEKIELIRGTIGTGPDISRHELTTAMQHLPSFHAKARPTYN